MYTLHNATHSNKKTHTGMVSDDNTMVLNDYYCIFMVFSLRFRTIGFIYIGFFNNTNSFTATLQTIGAFTYYVKCTKTCYFHGVYTETTFVPWYFCKYIHAYLTMIP